MADFEQGRTMVVKKYVKQGLGFGAALAMVISYTNWHSILWAIFHGILGCLYVIYFAIRYGLNAVGIG